MTRSTNCLRVNTVTRKSITRNAYYAYAEVIYAYWTRWGKAAARAGSSFCGKRENKYCFFSSAHAINGNSEKTKVAWPEVLEKSKTPQKLKNHEDDSKSTSETPDCPDRQPLIGWRLPGTCRERLGLRLKTHDCPDGQPLLGGTLPTGQRPAQSLQCTYV